MEGRSRRPLAAPHLTRHYSTQFWRWILNTRTTRTSGQGERSSHKGFQMCQQVRGKGRLRCDAAGRVSDHLWCLKGEKSKEVRRSNYNCQKIWERRRWWTTLYPKRLQCLTTFETISGERRTEVVLDKKRILNDEGKETSQPSLGAPDVKFHIMELTFYMMKHLKTLNNWFYEICVEWYMT